MTLASMGLFRAARPPLGTTLPPMAEVDLTVRGAATTILVLRLQEQQTWCEMGTNGEGHALVVECLRGLLWVTSEGDGRDLVVTRGEATAMVGGGRVVIGALVDSEVRVNRGQRSAPRRRGVPLLAGLAREWLMTRMLHGRLPEVRLIPIRRDGSTDEHGFSLPPVEPDPPIRLSGSYRAAWSAAGGNRRAHSECGFRLLNVSWSLGHARGNPGKHGEGLNSP
jgi:Protein of unknown function (DUF2917)